MALQENYKLNILTIIESQKVEKWTKIFLTWEKYFEIHHELHTDADEIKNHLNKRIDIIFLDYSYIESFSSEYYKTFQENASFTKTSSEALNSMGEDRYQVRNKNDDSNNSYEHVAKYMDGVLSKFKLVIVKNKMANSDYKIYKDLVDDIIYLENSFENVKWKSIAILRRFWNFYSKPTTIIYKNIIADFIDNKVIVDSKEVKLTQKEFALLKYFLNNRGFFIDRNQIFHDVWNYEPGAQDTTRSVDQIIFKLKTKIGSLYFETSRHKQGIKFE